MDNYLCHLKQQYFHIIVCWSTFYLSLHPWVSAQTPGDFPSRPARSQGKHFFQWLGSCAAQSPQGTWWSPWNTEDSSLFDCLWYGGSLIKILACNSWTVVIDCLDADLLVLSRSSLDCSSSLMYFCRWSLMALVSARSSSKVEMCLRASECCVSNFSYKQQ